MKNIFSLVICLVLSFVQIGCGGGGGGGGGGSAVKIIDFSSWASVSYPSRVTIGGISVDGSYTAPPPSYTVTSVTDYGYSNSSSTTIKYRTNGTIERVDIKTPNGTVTWDETAGDIIDDSDIVITFSDPAESKIGLAVNAIDPLLGWEYQTFGIWETGRGQGSGYIGAITVGAPTPGSAIPTTGDVTFLGLSTGVYINSTGTNDYLTVSAVTADVDFLNRDITLSTTDTQKISTTTAAVTDAPNLNMTGNLSYSAGSNSFSGEVNTSEMNGTSTGQFYGPNAQELSGVFSLSGPGLERYAGAYGAAR